MKWRHFGSAPDYLYTNIWEFDSRHFDNLLLFFFSELISKLFINNILKIFLTFFCFFLLKELL